MSKLSSQYQVKNIPVGIFALSNRVKYQATLLVHRSILISHHQSDNFAKNKTYFFEGVASIFGRQKCLTHEGPLMSKKEAAMTTPPDYYFQSTPAAGTIHIPPGVATRLDGTAKVLSQRYSHRGTLTEVLSQRYCDGTM